MSRTILVSNRLPFTIRRQGKETTLVASAGGLVAGLAPVHKSQSSLWIGNLGGELDKKTQDLLKRYRLVPVPLPRDQARRHYEGFSNGAIWPLFHYFLESVNFDPRDFEAYQSVNERFADVIAQYAQRGDRVWIHDYHLMLLPSMIRRRIPSIRVGFFLHIPFPSSEVFRVLPAAEAILRGMLGADLIGLHTYNYARHLATAYRRLLGQDVDKGSVEWEGSHTHIRVMPLGIDFERHAKIAASPEVERRLSNWRKRVMGRKVVLGVDRLDYSKGIPLRLEAYRRLMMMEPRWRKDVLFLQLTVPSRSSIPHYKALKQDVEQRIGQINGEFGELGMVPIHYIYRSVPPEELAALYRLADVAMVTPLRDGMNLVAKEYIASRLDHSGALVLSEFAGAATELGEALVVNPWDLDGTAQAIDRALRMDPEEAGRRMAVLHRRVAGNDAQQWARGFIKELDACERGQDRAAQETEDATWEARLIRSFALAQRPLMALAYDGTLREFDSVPEGAHPHPELLGLLKRLSRVPRARIILMSGRDRVTLEQWLGDLPIDLVAEHGFFFRKRAQKNWEELAPEVDRSWMPAVEEAMASYVARTPGSFIERKHAGLSWHYRKAEQLMGLRQGRELAHHLTEYFANRPLRIVHGSCVVEANHEGVGKGWAYRRLLRRVSAFDFGLVAGDDRSDEGLFQATTPDVWSIKVGVGSTSARFRLQSPGRLRALLSAALDARGTVSLEGETGPASSRPTRPRSRTIVVSQNPPDPRKRRGIYKR